jgi:hypothetical protein
MEGTAAAAAATATATAEKASSYRYWVREATGDAAPLPVPRKLDPAANGNGNGNPPALGSVWNQVSPAPSRLVSSTPSVRLPVLDWRRNPVSSRIVTSWRIKGHEFVTSLYSLLVFIRAWNLMGELTNARSDTFQLPLPLCIVDLTTGTTASNNQI